MSFRVTNTVQMRGETCWRCGIQFAMPEVWAKRSSETGRGLPAHVQGAGAAHEVSQHPTDSE